VFKRLRSATTSKERSLACVEFDDTPGIVDGDMKVSVQVQEFHRVTICCYICIQSTS
jgi:hypothetical protein